MSVKQTIAVSRSFECDEERSAKAHPQLPTGLSGLNAMKSGVQQRLF